MSPTPLPKIRMDLHRSGALLNLRHDPKPHVHLVHYYDSTIALSLGDAHEKCPDHLLMFNNPLVQVAQDCFILAFVQDDTASHSLMMKASGLLQVQLPVFLFRPRPVRFILYATFQVDFVIGCFHNPLCRRATEGHRH